MYVFDPSAIMYIFEHYYQKRFPSFWIRFYEQVRNGNITSVREALGEIQYPTIAVEWANSNKHIFSAPSAAEGLVVKEIYEFKKFQEEISESKLLKRIAISDAFVVAKGRICDSMVVTQQDYKPNLAKIPNICASFGVRCCNIEQFMDKEKWEF